MGLFQSAVDYTHRQAVASGRRGLCLNSAKTKFFIASVTSGSGLKPQMLVYTFSTNIISFDEANVTWQSTDPYPDGYYSVAQSEVGDFGTNLVDAVAMYSDAENPWSDYGVFHGQYNVETELWTSHSHVYAPFDPLTHTGGASKIFKIDSKLHFIAFGESLSDMGTPYARRGHWTLDGTTWVIVSDADANTPGAFSAAETKYSYYDSDADRDRVLIKASWNTSDSRCFLHPYPVTSSNETRAIFDMEGNEPINAYPDSPDEGLECFLTTSGTNILFTKARISSSTSYDPDASLYEFNVLHYQKHATLGYAEFIVASWRFSSGDSLVWGIVRLNASIQITDYYEFAAQDSGSNVIDGIFHIWEDTSTLYYAGYTTAYYCYYHEIDKAGTPNNINGELLRGNSIASGSVEIKYINNIDGSLVRGISALYGTLTVEQAPDNILSGSLIRGNSIIDGAFDVQLRLVLQGVLLRGNSIVDSFIRLIQPFVDCDGDLVRGKSELDSDIRNQFFYFYQLEFFTNIAKSNTVLENIRFIADIDGTEYPMTGFAIRSNLVNSDTEISNLIDCRFSMTSDEIDIIIPEIGTAVLTIKSVYNFGSSSVETELFSGILESALKRNLTDFANVKASNNETVSSSGTYTADKVITVSGAMSRLEFEPTLKPNDSIVIDGSERLINRIVSYNYTDSGAFTEVYYG